MIGWGVEEAAVSEKLECPGCWAKTSALLHAVQRDHPCPHCGLSADAITEIRAVRNSQADERLREELTAALKRQDQLERENRTLREAITHIEDALSELRTSLNTQNPRETH